MVSTLWPSILLVQTHWLNVRQAYYQRCIEVYNTPVPDHIPRNLYAFEKRTSVDPERWPSTWAIWIRTWYGNDVCDGGSIKGAVTCASADEAYLRLWRRAFHPLEHNEEFDDDVVGPFLFDDDAATYGVMSGDADDEVELLGKIPSFVLSALMRCPDAMEGCSESGWSYWLTETEEEQAQEQAKLVLVADREACEDGWVLMIALNHKGQVLHMRSRCKAYEVALNVTFWRDGGEPLDITGEEENVVDYRDANGSGNGWDDDSPNWIVPS